MKSNWDQQKRVATCYSLLLWRDLGNIRKIKILPYNLLLLAKRLLQLECAHLI